MFQKHHANQSSDLIIEMYGKIFPKLGHCSIIIHQIKIISPNKSTPLNWGVFFAQPLNEKIAPILIRAPHLNFFLQNWWYPKKIAGFKHRIANPFTLAQIYANSPIISLSLVTNSARSLVTNSAQNYRRFACNYPIKC